MASPADYHMHTPLCRHAVGEVEQYAEQAEIRGLKEIGFADHSPMARDDFDDWRMRYDQLSAYVSMVQAARKKFPALTIRLGLEIDYLPGHEKWIERLVAEHPWDYVIGSVHYVSESWAIDNPHQLSQWRERSADDVWTTYIERLSVAASSELFDIIGHIDLPKKFGFLPKANLKAAWDRFFKAARQAGCAVELNTGGLRKNCQEIYPAAGLVKELYGKGIPITFGSDAHAPEEVGFAFAEASAVAREAGFSNYTRFEARRSITTPLAD